VPYHIFALAYYYNHENQHGRLLDTHKYTHTNTLTQFTLNYQLQDSV